MKPLHFVTQHINQWRRVFSPRWRRLHVAPIGSPCPSIANTSFKTIGHTLRTHQPLRSLLLKELSGCLSVANPPQTQPLRSRRGKRKRSSVTFVLTLVSLTSTMGHHFYNQPKLDVGTVAPQTFWAPSEASIEDTKTTEVKRKAARRGLVPVLMVDPAVNRQIYQTLEQSLEQLDEVRQRPGPFPFTKTSTLSLSTQLYLRNCPEWEWRTVLATVGTEIVQKSEDQLTFSPTPSSPLTLSPIQQRAVAELQAYRRSTSAQEVSTLLNKIASVRQLYAQALAAVSHPSEAATDPLSDATILQLSDADWQATRQGVRQVAERVLTQGIPPGLPASLLQGAVNMQVKAQLPATAQPAATKLLMSVLQPNLKEDPEQTKLQAEQAVRNVPPEMVEIRKGEVIIQAGQVIDQADFVLLDYFGLSRRGINWLGLLGCGTLASGAIAVFWFVERRFHPGLRRRDHFLILLLTLSTPLLVSLGVPYTSLPAIGLLMGSFYGSALGIAAVGLLTFGLPVTLEISWDFLLAGAAGGLLASLLAGRLRSREELALLGVAVGLTEGMVYLLVNLLLSASVGPIWYTALGDAAIHSLMGLAWSVVALGLSPYLEHLFDLVTPIRLAELANPNRPLLKRLAEEAPGTFQHTLFVACLAEAAAKALGCNVELVRTGTLYHDIGKLHDPQGFIENQMGGPNKHDEIDDPWESADIIKKHVSEGLVMARKYRLPKAIQAFIPEHQGTILIAYFYHKAQQLAEANSYPHPVQEEEFRYDGPTPQSRETGIVMLADACEAALRSLKEVSYEEALTMVNKIFKARWQDNQLVDSGLTREEINQIAEIFVQVWQQFHHKRIAYPKAALCPK